MYAMNGSDDKIKELIRNNPNLNINVQDTEGINDYKSMDTALHLAARNNHLTTVKLLHSLQCNIDSRNK